jgi:hypothetical protein
MGALSVLCPLGSWLCAIAAQQGFCEDVCECDATLACLFCVARDIRG